jgi:hypothetical protein
LVDLVLVFMSLQAGAAHLAATLFGDVDLLSFQKPPISNDLDGRLKVTWDTAFPGDSDRTIDLTTCRIAWLLLANNGQSPLEGANAIKAPLSVDLQGDGEFLLVRQIPPNSTALYPKCHIAIDSGRKAFTVSTEDFINPRDYILILIIHSGDENALTMSGRVMGQENIQLTRTTASLTDLEPFITSADDRRRSAIWWIVSEGICAFVVGMAALLLKHRLASKEASLRANLKFAAPWAALIPLASMVLALGVLLVVPIDAMPSSTVQTAYFLVVFVALAALLAVPLKARPPQPT